MKTPVLDINGSKMTFWDMGIPQGPPVLLLHGLFESKEVWANVVTVLKDKYRLIAPDQRSHGETVTAPDAGMKISDFVDDVGALMAQLRLEQLFGILGHSWGGVVAQAFGQRRGPAGRLVLCNTTAKTLQIVRKEVDPKKFAEAMGTTMFSSWLKGEKAPVGPFDMPLVAHGYVVTMNRFADAPRNAEIMRRFDQNGDLKNFDIGPGNMDNKIPCAIITGKYDEIITAEESGYLKSSLPGVPAFDLDTGHLPFTSTAFINLISNIVRS